MLKKSKNKEPIVSNLPSDCNLKGCLSETQTVGYVGHFTLHLDFFLIKLFPHRNTVCYSVH